MSFAVPFGQKDEEKIVYMGVGNPKGESPLYETTYLDTLQLRLLVSQLKDIPMYIEHFTHTNDGKPIEPCGKTLGAFMHPNTGELWLGFKTYTNATGTLAKGYLGEDIGDFYPEELQGIFPDPKSVKMFELSLGHRVDFNVLNDGREVPFANAINEVSICQKGARENTKIKFRIDVNKKKVDFLSDLKEEPGNKKNQNIIDKEKAYTKPTIFSHFQNIQNIHQHIFGNESNKTTRKPGNDAPTAPSKRGGVHWENNSYIRSFIRRNAEPGGGN